MIGRLSHRRLSHHRSVVMLPLLSLLLLGIQLPCEAQSVDYVRDVYPILETYCVGCHTADDAQGGLVMEDFSSLSLGGDSGPAVTPGSAGSSRLLLMASGKLEPVMPPDDAEGPNEEELEILARWIDQGAAGPSGPMPVKRQLRAPKIAVSPSAPTPITAVAISPDGSHRASAQFQKVTIESKQGPTVTIDDGELGKVNSICFSPSGDRLLVASGLTGAYGRAAIYDAPSGKLVREFLGDTKTGHRDTLYAAQFSPDGKWVATAGYDRVIILWNAETGKPVRSLVGHNGAIFDLAFSSDGKVLVSGCADETAKVWNVSTGQRLDTLSQPEGEVFAVGVTPDNRFIVAGSGDNRIRIWKLKSIEKPRINPITATRFVAETPIVNFAFSPDGTLLAAVAESGAIKILRTSDWQTVDSVGPFDDSVTDVCFDPAANTISIALMNGRLIHSEYKVDANEDRQREGRTIERVYMDLGEPDESDEQELQKSVEIVASSGEQPSPLDIGRNVRINGQIAETGERDFYRWHAKRGEVWAIDADAVAGGRLDPVVTVLDATGQPVLRTRLQAVRDSYFTFRGKNSSQVNDFRLFAWQEMKLGEYLYAAGEVTKLSMHPRGPDSGFNVYPNEGNRWTYFGTSGRTHALGEPAYIVRPLNTGEQPLANGLPVFDIAYENDDSPYRIAGKNSRLVFVAPEDGLFTVRVGDTRGEGGKEYGYSLTIRAAAPSFTPTSAKVTKPLKPGTGREFRLRVDRLDGYRGPVTFEITGLPERFVSNFPVTIEAGQRFADGVIWIDPNEAGWEGEIEPTLVASALIEGKRVERDAGTCGKLTFDGGIAQVIPSIVPMDENQGPHEHWTLQVRRGETAMARVLVERKEGFKNEISFGKEGSGRNASQGVYVDNIGLNGLLIVAGANEREFFVTADETAVPGKRSFFLSAGVDGGLSSRPITVEVLP